MAAGIGSRFGTGIKQLAKMSDHGEIIMDYSIYDAKKAGFDKVIFVIRKEIEKEFKEVIGNRIEKEMAVEYAYQELPDLPNGYSVPAGRTKPWGTGQAILACRELIREPFVIINADDYYGSEAFQRLHDFLISPDSVEDSGRDENKLFMAMAGYTLENTLSENGTVTRGICVTDDQGMLTHITETKGIKKENDRIICEGENVNGFIQPDSTVSMNMWAAQPEFLPYLEAGFREFLDGIQPDPLKKEYLLPDIISKLLNENKISVKVIPTSDHWIGITYQEDIAPAQKSFQEMIREGKYPGKLF